MDEHDDEIYESSEFTDLYRSPCGCRCRDETRAFLDRIDKIEAQLNKQEKQIKELEQSAVKARDWIRRSWSRCTDLIDRLKIKFNKLDNTAAEQGCELSFCLDQVQSLVFKDFDPEQTPSRQT